jgi:hypothetical protein
VFDAYYTQQEIMANKGGNERDALRLEGVHGDNVEVELSDRFQQVTGHARRPTPWLPTAAGAQMLFDRDVLESRCGESVGASSMVVD